MPTSLDFALQAVACAQSLASKWFPLQENCMLFSDIRYLPSILTLPCLQDRIDHKDQHSIQ